MTLAIILAENAPPKSKAEMFAMAELDKVRTVRLAGTLGIYEEYPEAVTEASQANFRLKTVLMRMRSIIII